MRNNAAYALAELGSAKSVPYLIPVLIDSDEWVRKNAVKALGILRAEHAVGALIQSMQDFS